MADGHVRQRVIRGGDDDRIDIRPADRGPPINSGFATGMGRRQLSGPRNLDVRRDGNRVAQTGNRLCPLVPDQTTPNNGDTHVRVS